MTLIRHGYRHAIRTIVSWFSRSSGASGFRRVTVYSKPDCHLCDDVHTVLLRVRQDIPFHLDEIDISTDQALLERYQTKIPVVLLDGKERFWYRVDERRFRRELSK